MDMGGFFGGFLFCGCLLALLALGLVLSMVCYLWFLTVSSLAKDGNYIAQAAGGVETLPCKENLLSGPLHFCDA